MEVEKINAKQAFKKSKEYIDYIEHARKTDELGYVFLRFHNACMKGLFCEVFFNDVFSLSDDTLKELEKLGFEIHVKKFGYIVFWGNSGKK